MSNGCLPDCPLFCHDATNICICPLLSEVERESLNEKPNNEFIMISFSISISGGCRPKNPRVLCFTPNPAEQDGLCLYRYH